MAFPDDDMSSQLRDVLTERNQADAGLGAAIEVALMDGVEPVMPPPAAMTGLLAQIRATDRMTHFAPQLAAHYDLTIEAALALIAQIRGNTGWVDGLAPGLKMLPVQTGPRLQGELSAIVYLEPGAVFPDHPHLGPEDVLVLEGAYVDSSGAEYWRGEVHRSVAGTHHSFQAIGGIPCICAGLHAISRAES